MKNDPSIAILILNWNNYPDTRKCLDSLGRLTYDNYQVILIDNGSTDGSYTKLMEEFPEITFLGIEKNLGFAGGNNVGLKYALENDFPYILLLNNDTEVIQEGFLSKIMLEIQSDESIGAVGPKIFQLDGKPEETILPYPNLHNSILDTLGRYKPDMFTRQVVDSVSGCCVLIRSTVIEQAGLLDENYFMYAEETEWFFRIRKKGWKILYLPIDSILHKGASSSKRLETKSVYVERRANVIYTLVKGNQSLQALFMAVFMILLVGLRIIISAIKNLWGVSNPIPVSTLRDLVSEIIKKWNLAKKIRPSNSNLLRSGL